METEFQRFAMRKIETNENVSKDKINTSVKIRNANLYFEPPVLFVHPKDEPITPEVIQKFITLHKGEVPRYQYLYDMYKGKHEIFNQKEKDEHKPDNRLVTNFCKYIVDTFCGYAVGIPPKITHVDKDVEAVISKFNKRVEMDDIINELFKMSSIFGRSYAITYQDESAETCTTYNSPLDTFIVYDDTSAQKPLFAVRYRNTDEGIAGEVFTLESHYLITTNLKGEILLEDDPEQAFYYGELSVTEFYANEERTSIFEPIITLNNAFNKGFSEKGNDIDYFSDAYLAVLGAEIDEKTTHTIRENRVINVYGTDPQTKVDIKFLEKPNADESQENYLDRLERLIFAMSMVVNINDDNFGNKASGESLRFKYGNMSNLAKGVERKFKPSLASVYKMFFSVPINFDNHTEELASEWMNLEYKFTQNVPKNIKEEAEIMQMLDTNVSEETKLSVLSIIPNVKDEIERLRQEESERPGGYDFENDPVETKEEIIIEDKE